MAQQPVFVAQPRVAMVVDSAGTALVDEETEAAERAERTEAIGGYNGPVAGPEAEDGIGGTGVERVAGKEKIAADKDYVLGLPVAFASFVVPAVARAVHGAVGRYVVDVASVAPNVGVPGAVVPSAPAQDVAAQPFAAPPRASAPISAVQPVFVAQDAAVPAAVAVAVEVSGAPISADAYAPVVAGIADVASVATAAVSVEETAVATEAAAAGKWRS